MKKGYVGVYSGHEFSTLNPCAKDVKIEDIAHSLSNICRFNGHSRFFYSVAQHSIAVQQMMKEDNCSIYLQLCSILHDATEFVTCDLPTPWKCCIKGFKEIENGIEDAIFDAFGIKKPSEEEHSIIKEYDRKALYVESKHLMVGYENWDNIIIYPGIDYPIIKRPQEEVEEEFLWRFNSLLAKLSKNYA